MLDEMLSSQKFSFSTNPLLPFLARLANIHLCISLSGAMSGKNIDIAQLGFVERRFDFVKSNQAAKETEKEIEAGGEVRVQRLTGGTKALNGLTVGNGDVKHVSIGSGSRPLKGNNVDSVTADNVNNSSERGPRFWRCSSLVFSQQG